MDSATTSPDSSATAVVLAPLDERPVNTRYPQMLGAIAGMDVLLPPTGIIGRQCQPADVDAVGRWLLATAALPSVGSVVASADFLAYGNLINARCSLDSATDALARLRPLEEVGATRSVYAFGLITRVSRANDCVEEPLYWADYGVRFYQLSQLLHQAEADTITDDQRTALARLRAEIPKQYQDDWMQRRLRNHTVNLALVDMLARERISFLLLTSDDTSPWGTPSREKGWLESWLRLLGPSVMDRTMMHPGADEVGSALVARSVVDRAGATPTVCAIYAVPGGEHIIAPYEDRPVSETVSGQISACGCRQVSDPETADIILGVVPPSPRRTEFRADFAASEREERLPFYRDFFVSLGQYQQSGRQVAIGDVAYPNGADPMVIELLLDGAGPVDPAALAAYGGWNTAGNTLGVVVAQAVCSMFSNSSAERRAHCTFLTHRFLEDWAYQAVVRRQARDYCERKFGRRDPDPDSLNQVGAVCSEIEVMLRDALVMLQRRGIGAGLTLVPGSVSLPWNRTFEVDFELN